MKTGKRYLTRAGFIGLVVISTCWGCSGIGLKLEQWQTSVTETFKETLNFSDSEPSVDAKQNSSDVYFIHTSRWSWETLEVVADWYTEDSRNWKRDIYSG